MKILNKITNGILLIIIGLLHTQLVLSPDAFGSKFKEFADSNFFNIHPGTEALPFIPSENDVVAFAAFWFFYFGLFVIVLGVLIHSIERKSKTLPHAFTFSYLVFILIGCYMLPNSGMTLIMLPHAIYMLVINFVRKKRISKLSSK